MDAGGAYGGSKAGGTFDPIAFVQRPPVILRAVCWVFILCIYYTCLIYIYLICNSFICINCGGGCCCSKHGDTKIDFSYSAFPIILSWSILFLMLCLIYQNIDLKISIYILFLFKWIYKIYFSVIRNFYWKKRIKVILFYYKNLYV